MKIAIVLDVDDAQAALLLEQGRAVRWPPSSSAVSVTIATPTPGVVELVAASPALFIEALRRRFPAVRKDSCVDRAERCAEVRAFALLMDGRHDDELRALGCLDPGQLPAPATVLAAMSGFSEQWARVLLREARKEPASAFAHMRQTLAGSESTFGRAVPLQREDRTAVVSQWPKQRRSRNACAT